MEGLTQAGSGAVLSSTATAAWETSPAKGRAHLPNEQVLAKHPRDESFALGKNQGSGFVPAAGGTRDSQ